MKRLEKLATFLHSPCEPGQKISVSEDGQLHCSASATTFPMLGSIPWLYPDAAKVVAQWRQRYHYMQATIEREIETLKLEQREAGLL